MHGVFLTQRFEQVVDPKGVPRVFVLKRTPRFIEIEHAECAFFVNDGYVAESLDILTKNQGSNRIGCTTRVDLAAFANRAHGKSRLR